MNFLAMAANKLGDRLEERMTAPSTAMGRIASRLGLTHANVDTPTRMGDPVAVHRSMMQDVQQPGSVAASPEREAMARERGFKNYEEMLLWAKQRNMPVGASQAGGPTQRSVAQTLEDAIRNPRAAWDTMMAIHPTNMFNNITARMRSATNPDEQ